MGILGILTDLRDVNSVGSDLPDGLRGRVG